MPSVADFLIERLENTGMRHIFTVPGSYVLPFLKRLCDSTKIKVVNNTDENHCGFAADAYARVSGVGAVVTTYGVGALKVCNAIGEAYTERSPIILISGAPGMKQREEGVALHHMVRGFDNQFKMFENITCCSVLLDDPTTAGYKIDMALEKLHHHKQPIYIELPRDVAVKPIRYDVYHQGTPTAPETDQTALHEAMKEVFAWLDEAERPVILAGVQMSRFNLGGQLLRFAEKHNIPIATTLLSKSVVDERHPLFLGLYAGRVSGATAQEYVEGSDCLLILGEAVTDMTCGFTPLNFAPGNVVSCSVEGLKIKNHNFKNVRFVDFCKNLFDADLGKHKSLSLPKPQPAKFEPQDGKVTVSRFFTKVGSLMSDPKFVLVADIGESLFGAMHLTVSQHRFISPALYSSMGFAIPGALGVQLAKADLRPVVLVGDGAFQMSCTDLSTIAQQGLNPIVFVLNNKGYSTERAIMEGPFNDIRNWNYHKVVDMINGGKSFAVETEAELDAAVKAALAATSLSVINVILDPKDTSANLRRLAENFAKSNK